MTLQELEQAAAHTLSDLSDLSPPILYNTSLLPSEALYRILSFTRCTPFFTHSGAKRPHGLGFSCRDLYAYYRRIFSIHRNYLDNIVYRFTKKTSRYVTTTQMGLELLVHDITFYRNFMVLTRSFSEEFTIVYGSRLYKFKPTRFALRNFNYAHQTYQSVINSLLRSYRQVLKINSFF